MTCLLVIIAVIAIQWHVGTRNQDDVDIKLEIYRRTVVRTTTRTLLLDLLAAKDRADVDKAFVCLDPADKKLIDEVHTAFALYRTAKEFEGYERKGLITPAEFTDEFKESFRKLITSQGNEKSNTKNTADSRPATR